jgi:hypothetical protein
MRSLAKQILKPRANAPKRKKGDDIVIAEVVKPLVAKVGRPTSYTLAMALEITKQLATTNKGIKTLCEQNPHWPARTTVFEWRLMYKEFADLYAQAKRDQIESMIDEIQEISDNMRGDTIITYDEAGEPVERCNTEWLGRSRLRIDTRKWIAAKLAPKLYGEKIQNETTVTIIKHEEAIKELA